MSYKESPEVTKYIASFDASIQKRLTDLRHLIQSRFPNTIEDISYSMPTYRPAPGKRGIVHFAVAKNHIGLYAVIDATENDSLYTKLQRYQTGRGTLQFKHTEPLPLDIIDEILQYHAQKIKL